MTALLSRLSKIWLTRRAEKLVEADGLVFGSPVFYAGISGQLKCFMDRLFYSQGARLAGKPAAAVVSARRGGCATTFDDINRFFTINCMPVVSSQYWNQVHGNTPDEGRLYGIFSNFRSISEKTNAG